jgi:hypothetical protein
MIYSIASSKQYRALSLKQSIPAIQRPKRNRRRGSKSQSSLPNTSISLTQLLNEVLGKLYIPSVIIDMIVHYEMGRPIRGKLSLVSVHDRELGDPLAAISVSENAVIVVALRFLASETVPRLLLWMCVRDQANWMINRFALFELPVIGTSPDYPYLSGFAYSQRHNILVLHINSRTSNRLFLVQHPENHEHHENQSNSKPFTLIKSFTIAKEIENRQWWAACVLRVQEEEDMLYLDSHEAMWKVPFMILLKAEFQEITRHRLIKVKKQFIHVNYMPMLNKRGSPSMLYLNQATVTYGPFVWELKEMLSQAHKSHCAILPPYIFKWQESPFSNGNNMEFYNERGMLVHGWVCRFPPSLFQFDLPEEFPWHFSGSSARIVGVITSNQATQIFFLE